MLKVEQKLKMVKAMSFGIGEQSIIESDINTKIKVTIIFETDDSIEGYIKVE